jgi:4-diphosphocytidyl-2-C-methyl-D-erythritol kinase
MRVLAPAKINLHLRVGPRRDDGFHSLVSWMVTVGLFDTLTFERARSSSTAPTTGVPEASRFALACNRPEIPVDEANLVHRAATLLAASSPLPSPPTHCLLEKQIPSGAGLGGGSSDAARTLLALNRFWHLDRPVDDLAPLAARLGSDVPFFLYPPSAICAGRGERVRFLSAPQPRWALLVLPPIHMPTPLVYRRFDEMGLGTDLTDEPDWAAWTRLGAADLLQRLVNDLEPPAFAISPELSDLRRAIEDRLGRTVRMSGSGSSLFTLFDAETEALAASEAVRSTPAPVHVVAVAPAIKDELARE